MRYLLLLIVFPALFWACQPEEACISSATNRFVVEFLSEDNPDITTDDRYFRRIYSLVKTSENTLTGYVFWEDTARARIENTFLLVMNPDSDTTTFVFEHTAAEEGEEPPVADTLIFTYQRRYRLISPDCPLEVTFRDLRLVRTTFDSAQVVNTELIEPSDATDVQVFD
ncbi:hypothetical protein D770_12015 [Flammeovirgaceae bacterium 311]|nr:hypothetical protein D770_12015 [Flammeovirgaceae bacterium 311]